MVHHAIYCKKTSKFLFKARRRPAGGCHQRGTLGRKNVCRIFWKLHEPTNPIELPRNQWQGQWLKGGFSNMGWMFCIFLAILKETFSPILQQTNSNVFQKHWQKYSISSTHLLIKKGEWASGVSLNVSRTSWAGASSSFSSSTGGEAGGFVNGKLQV